MQLYYATNQMWNGIDIGALRQRLRCRLPLDYLGRQLFEQLLEACDKSCQLKQIFRQPFPAVLPLLAQGHRYRLLGNQANGR